VGDTAPRIARIVVTWKRFADEAPQIADLFVRRHTATGKLCLLGTLRSDGYPRISPVEPRILEGELVVVGMEGTHKFRDLARDPRFSLHTATVDPYVGDGDAKVWGQVKDLQDKALHERFADDLFEESGLDLRGRDFDPFYVADLEGASSLELVEGELVISIWKPGEGVRVVRKS
jgi:hypothetical protein